MENKESTGLFWAIIILISILGFSMVNENFINKQIQDNMSQTIVLPVSENTYKNSNQLLNIENPLQIQAESLNKIKKDSLDLELRLNENSFYMNNENLIPTDLLSVALNGGQSIKSTIDLLINKGYSIEQSLNLMYKNWNDLLNSFLSNYEIEPIDSNITFEPNDKNMFTYSQSHMGKKLDRDNFYKEFYSKLFDKKIKIELSLSECEPKYTESLNKEITKEASHFITDLSNSKKNRHHNVTNALKKINGLKIEPKQIVSFNELTSPQDSSGGYINATIISNGEYVDGMGGGICQASSTLYNAVLLAGLKVIKVYKHSIPVSYVKMGLDSMVSSYADLVFENTSEYPIYIKAFTDTESAYVYLYGKTMADDEYIVRRNEIVRTIPAPKEITIIDTKQKYYPKVEYQDESFELRYPRQGYEVNAYLDYYKGKNKIKTEKIRNEIYAPQERIIVKGAKERVKEEINMNNENMNNDNKKMLEHNENLIQNNKIENFKKPTTNIDNPETIEAPIIETPLSQEKIEPTNKPNIDEPTISKTLKPDLETQ